MKKKWQISTYFPWVQSEDDEIKSDFQDIEQSQSNDQNTLDNEDSKMVVTERTYVTYIIK